MNVRLLRKLLELLSENRGRFEINQLLFADDTALVADSEEKLCRLVKVKSSMARSLPVENLLPQNVGSIINYLQ